MRVTAYGTAVSVEDTMEKGVKCVSACMRISAAGEELSRVVAVAPELRNISQRQQASTAVLVTTDPNLLIHGSPAVASGMSYCCGPAIQEVGVCVGEHTSGCLLSLC